MIGYEHYLRANQMAELPVIQKPSLVTVTAVTDTTPGWNLPCH